MLTLAELSHAVCVSREWFAAVRTMKAIGASIEPDDCGSEQDRRVIRLLPPIARIVGSPLLRHLTLFQLRHPCVSWTPLNNASLGLLAHYAPNLQSLRCTLTLKAKKPLILPAKLTSLQLQIDDEYADTAINRVLTTLAALPSLTCLRLQLSASEAECHVELGVLAACRSLTDLTLERKYGGAPQLSHVQLD